MCVYIYIYTHTPGSFPGRVAVENMLAHVGDIRDVGSSLGWEDYLEEGMATRIHGILHPMDRETWRATVYRVAKSQTCLKCLSGQALSHKGEAAFWASLVAQW